MIFNNLIPGVGANLPFLDHTEELSCTCLKLYDFLTICIWSIFEEMLWSLVDRFIINGHLVIGQCWKSKIDYAMKYK